MKETRRRGHSQPRSVHHLPVVLGFSGGVFWRPVQVFGRRVVADRAAAEVSAPSLFYSNCFLFWILRYSTAKIWATVHSNTRDAQPFLASLMITTNSTIDYLCPAPQLGAVFGPVTGAQRCFYCPLSFFANFTQTRTPNRCDILTRPLSRTFRASQRHVELRRWDPFRERRCPPGSAVEYHGRHSEYPT